MKALITGTIGMVLLLNPFVAYGAESLKLRYTGAVYADDKGVGMIDPEGVACNDKSSLIIADTGNGRLLRYTISEGTVKGGDPVTLPELSNPLATHISAGGDILVLDGKQRKIARIGTDGTFKGFIAPAGIPAPQEYIVRNFKTGSEGLYLLDIYSGRVLILDEGGKYLRHLPFPDEYGFMSDLAADAQGTVYLLDTVNGMIYSAPKGAKGFLPFSPKLEEYMNFPAGMFLDARGTLYLLDKHGSSVVAIGRDGSFRGRSLGFGWKEGLLNRPTQICINGKGEAFIADSANNRVQMFTIME